MIISDPKQIKLLTDPIKRRILIVLRNKVMTAREITEELNKWFAEKERFTVQKVNYHLRLLENANLIKVVREERLPDKPHIVTRYYGRVAPLYLIRYSLDSFHVPGKIKSKITPEKLCNILSAFDFNVTKEQCDHILELHAKLEKILYEELNNLSSRQKRPTGVEPDVLAYFFKIFGFILMISRKETIDIVNEILRTLGILKSS